MKIVRDELAPWQVDCDDEYTGLEENLEINDAEDDTVKSLRIKAGAGFNLAVVLLRSSLPLSLIRYHRFGETRLVLLSNSKIFSTKIGSLRIVGKTRLRWT